ncbi:hypothetical protein GJAV_G00073960 [Gymnothorax javanicus]|nr:hypothetical protein GJAV_G00073960 [Gymnothorax javanicus]
MDASVQRDTQRTADMKPMDYKSLDVRVADGGCAFSRQTSSSSPPTQPSLNLSIKSERVSPEHACSPATPPLHNVMHHSPIERTDSAGQMAPEPYTANERAAFQKGTYQAQHDAVKAQTEDKTRLAARRLETAEAWPR